MIAPESTTVPSRSKRTTGKRTTGAIVTTAPVDASTLLAAREAERADARRPAPEHDRVRREVLAREPEGAVVRRVDAQLAVVAPPPFRLRLRALARVQHLLGLRHPAERIPGRAAGVPQRRIVVCAGGAEADRDVALLVHRHAGHPARLRARHRVVRCVCALLVDDGVRRRAPDLVPADPFDGIRLHRVVQDERLVVAEVPIGEPEHEAVAERVETLGAALLQRAVAEPVRALRPDERCDRDRRARLPVIAEGRRLRVRPVDVEVPQAQVEAEVAAGGRDARGVVDLGEHVRLACARQARAVRVCR